MPPIVVRHKVGDFNTWIKGHQDRVNIFAPAGSSFKTFQDTDDPNSVLLVMEVTDLKMLGEIINDPANAHLKDSHTVLDPIVMSMQVDV